MRRRADRTRDTGRDQSRRYSPSLPHRGAIHRALSGLRLLSLLALLGAPLVAQTDRSPVTGPRITIDAVDQPLETILTDLAKQLNRRFTGYITDRGPSLRELQTLQLESATIPQLRAALWDLTGATMSRAARTMWTLNIARELPPEPLSIDVAEGRLRLDWLRFYYYRYLWPADPAHDQQVSILTPSLTYEAVDDVAGLRLLGMADAGATASDGEPLGLRQKGALTATPAPTDPASFALTPSLDAPGPEVKRLANVWIDLRFAERLLHSRIEFADLKSTAQQRGKNAGATAVLSARSEGEAPSLLTVTVTQPLPAVIDPKLDAAVLRREGWVEARFYDADGQPLLTEARLISVDRESLDDQQWVTRWQFSVSNQPWIGRTPADMAALVAPTPARLVLDCYRPAGKVALERVTFEDLPMPPREGDAPW